MITGAGAKKALKKRKAYAPTPILLRGDFPEQNAFIQDPSRFIAAQCSRRSGKSNGLALRFFQTMERYPGSQCLYLSLTQESARGIFWPVLKELNDIHKLGCTFVDSRMTMTHPNGAVLKLMGADLKDFIKRLKGRKYPGIAIDEAQDFSSHLQSLIDDVLTPSIADYTDGWLALTGTPGPVPHGVFFDITQNAKFGFSLHKWTVLNNPYMPDPHRFIEDLKARREWKDDHPTLLREWKNQWVLDTKALWIQYEEKLNHYIEKPKSPMTYVFGIDLGFKDADAVAVVGWTEDSSDTYLVEEHIMAKQGITELMDTIKLLQTKYNPCKMVIDEGGLGKKIAEELRKRHAIPVEAADKARKQENVELLNDHLRLGKFKAKSGSRFAKDSYLVQIDWDKSTPNRIVIKKNPHSDIIDAVLYAFKESPAYSYQPDAPRPRPGTDAWARTQEDEMWERECQIAQEAAESRRRADSMGYDD